MQATKPATAAPAINRLPKNSFLNTNRANPIDMGWRGFLL